MQNHRNMLETMCNTSEFQTLADQRSDESNYSTGRNSYKAVSSLYT